MTNIPLENHYPSTFYQRPDGRTRLGMATIAQAGNSATICHSCAQDVQIDHEKKVTG